jgi:hypothetical protein
LGFVHEGQAPFWQTNIQAPIQHPTVLIPTVPALGRQLQTVYLSTVFNEGHVAGLVGGTNGNRLPNSQLRPKENPDVEEKLRVSHCVKIREVPIFSQIIWVAAPAGCTFVSHETGSLPFVTKPIQNLGSPQPGFAFLEHAVTVRGNRPKRRAVHRKKRAQAVPTNT